MKQWEIPIMRLHVQHVVYDFAMILEDLGYNARISWVPNGIIVNAMVLKIMTNPHILFA